MFPAEEDDPLGLVCLLTVKRVCFSPVLLHNVSGDPLALQAATLRKPILLPLSVISLRKNHALLGDASSSQNSDEITLCIENLVKFGNAKVAKSTIIVGTVVGSHHI